MVTLRVDSSGVREFIEPPLTIKSGDNYVTVLRIRDRYGKFTASIVPASFNDITRYKMEMARRESGSYTPISDGE